MAMSVSKAPMAHPTAASVAHSADVVALVGVNVIPLETAAVTILENQTIVVEGDRITAIGSTDAVRVPQGAAVIEGAGGFVIPGLIDSHSHLLDNEDALILHIANGVTTIRDPNADYAGTGAVILGWRDEIAAGRRLGPTIFAAKSLIALPPQFGGVFGNLDKVTGPWLSMDPAALELAMDPESGAALVANAHEQGYDIIKVNWFLSRATFDRVVETAGELGMPIVAHVPADVGIEHTVRSGAEIQHDPNLIAFVAKDYQRQPGGGPNYLDVFDLSESDQKLPELVELMVESGVAFTPTMSTDAAAFEIFANLPDPSRAPMFQRPEYRYVSAAKVAEWKDPAAGELAVVVRAAGASRLEDILPPVAQREQMWAYYQRQLVALVEAGVPVLVGTDSSAVGVVWGFSEHRELEFFVAAGLAPYQALEAATRIPSEVMGGSDEFGTVSVGKRADLVLLRANPLEDISNTRQIAGVMTRGRWLPHAELQSMLEDLAAKYEADAAGAVVMAPYVGERFSGLAPTGWKTLEPGVLARGDPEVDPTILVQLAAPDTGAPALAARVLQRYGITELGPPSDRFEAEHLAWDIYLIKHQVGVMGLGLSEGEGTAYLVLLVGKPDQADALAKSAFFPALAAFKPID